MDIFSLIILLVFFLLSPIYIRYKKRHRTVTMTNAPVLLSYYTDDTRLTPIRRGEMKNYNYSVFVSDPNIFVSKGSMLIAVDLPFKTKLHLLGISKRKDISQIRTDVGRSVMEQVKLEGNYDDYFTLFTDKGMQVQARYIFDPKAMAFTADFCISHSWEIVNSEFYFVQENLRNVEGDETGMWQDVEKFIEEIRPVIEIPLTEEEDKLRNPYGEVLHIDLKCPICNGELKYNNGIYECTKGDGTLVHGSKLNDFRKGLFSTNSYPKQTSVEKPETLICPNCENQMQKVAYAGSKTEIDSCVKCHFRWLDSGELSK